MPRRRTGRPVGRHLAAALALCAGLVLTGCGTQQETASGGGSTPAPSDAGSGSAAAQETQTISVRVDGDRVTPRNERIQVRAGEPITLRVVSDRKGELHVHSSPETTFDFGPGTSSRTITLERPGLVEMEEHVSDTLVAQLEAR